jgi:uncharacterized protein YlxW (UPF0749 family)
MLDKVKSLITGKERIISIALSMALLFFFASSATLAQNKPEKNDTKTVKQVEQKTNQQNSKSTVKPKITNTNTSNLTTSKNRSKSTVSKDRTKSLSNLTVSKDKTKKTTKIQHHKKQGTTNKIKMNENKAPVKDDTNNKVK